MENKQTKKEKLRIYTDGSAKANGKENNEGGFGVVVYNEGKIIDAYQERHINTTNNQMEMRAILWAMKNYGQKNPIVYSDSSYAINSFTSWKENWKRNDWKRPNGENIKNLDLIQLFDNYEQLGYNITLVKVCGHRGLEGNEYADLLATGNLNFKELLGKQNFDPVE